ncbi:Na+/H+ antiporter [Aquabacter cavernae]|uniref:Na+/H+ antiporter n=1 Tax=Aquabacter cavernae TaxID=2496029 RepID=UPI000F8D2EA6|nr:Na+/H+ antiporter [Aquabacter cavernae]
METIGITLVLLLAVVVSGPLERILPLRIPRPLIQIALGTAIAVFTDLGVELHPQLFFLLFLPPLLFLDGWRTPREGLARDFGLIMALAFGLVVFTVVGLGFFIHWMIPIMPLPVAFALAAIISPTDTLAVSAILSGRAMPERLMRVLEGESLLNDASGLVCMQFAVAAAMTGAFSLTAAAEEFVWLATGGAAVGIAVTVVAGIAKNWISDKFGEDPGAQVLISILIPFGAYLLAEQIGCSPVLAAVAAGLTMTGLEQSGHLQAVSRLDRKVVWDIIQYTANGIVFVLLGEQLPQVIGRAADLVRDNNGFDLSWLALYTVAIVGLLAVMRYSWVWVSLSLAAAWARYRGQSYQSPDKRHVGAATLSGVRGAVTLAGVLTLPLHLPDGTHFPARDLAVFLAAAVIIVSLVLASAGLPLLVPRASAPRAMRTTKALSAVQVDASEAAIRAIEAARHKMSEGEDGGAPLSAEAAAHLIEIYRRRIEANSQDEAQADALFRTGEMEREMHIAALRAERGVYFEAARKRRVSEEDARRLVMALDLLEARLVSR